MRVGVLLWARYVVSERDTRVVLVLTQAQATSQTRTDASSPDDPCSPPACQHNSASAAHTSVRE